MGDSGLRATAGNSGNSGLSDAGHSTSAGHFVDPTVYGRSDSSAIFFHNAGYSPAILLQRIRALSFLNSSDPTIPFFQIRPRRTPDLASSTPALAPAPAFLPLLLHSGAPATRPRRLPDSGDTEYLSFVPPLLGQSMRISREGGLSSIDGMKASIMHLPRPAFSSPVALICTITLTKLVGVTVLAAYHRCETRLNHSERISDGFWL